MAATQIKKIASDGVASLSDSNGSVRIPRNKKSGTGVLCSNKGPHNKAHKHHGTQLHCVIYKKAGMTEQNYISHIAEDCFGERKNQKTIKDVLGGPMKSRAEAMKQYNKSKIKCRKELKYLKKQNNILFGITKKSVSRR